MLKVKELNDNTNVNISSTSRSESSSTNGNVEEIKLSFQPREDLYQVTTLQEADTKALSHQIAGHSRTGINISFMIYFD
jgi:hypothetical protein